MCNGIGKCLVLGGGGFLGNALTRLLLRMGRQVRVFGRKRYPAMEALGAECAQGDVLDYASVLDASRGCDTLFHTVAICDIVRGKQPYYNVNVRGTANVIRACLEAKVERLVYTSTPSVVVGSKDIVNGDESLPYAHSFESPYPATKAQAEKMVLDANSWETVPNTPEKDNPSLGEANVKRLLTCAIRPHLLWGEDDPHIIPLIIKLAEERRLKIVGDGRNIVSITHVENAAYAHCLAAMELAGKARCAGKAYFVNDTEPVALWPWINALLKPLGIPLVTRHISRRFLRTLGALNEVACACMPCLGAPKITRFVADQLARSHCFSHANATKDFGYTLAVQPQEGFAKMVDALILRRQAAAK